MVWITALFPLLIFSPVYVVSVNQTDGVSYLFKCCGVGKAFNMEGDCIHQSLSFNINDLYLDEPPENVTLVTGIMNCSEGRYRLEPQEDPEDAFNLLQDGRLTLPSQKDTVISHLDFCLEFFLGEDGNYTLLPLVCFPPPQKEDPWKAFTFVVYPIGCLLSVPALIGTVVVYLHPEMRTTQGKILVCHCSCLTIAFLSLVYLQIRGHNLPQFICITLGFVVQFSFVASFIWLNNLCIHLYRRIRRLSEGGLAFNVWSCSGESKSRGGTRSRDFIYYSIYGWSFPTIVVGFSLFADMSPSIPSTFLKPNFGVRKCWFSSNETALTYFYLPLVVVFVSNLTLFVLTARIIHKQHRTNHRKVKLTSMPDVVDALIKNSKLLMLRKSLAQCGALFMAMGLNWLSELISFFVGGQLWILTDIINTFQGIAIFLIFVWLDIKAKEIAKHRLLCFKKHHVIPEQQHLKDCKG